MFKSSLIAAGLVLAAAMPAAATEQLAPAQVITVPPASPAAAVSPAGEVQTRALQSLPFEPTSSVNDNPYETDCTRHRAKEQTVFYTN
jgi:hypothetical protein